MMKIKVISLESWMKYAVDNLIDDPTNSINDFSAIATKTIPIMDRDGFYMTRLGCWFEYRGMAFTYERQSFEYSLKMFNHRPLSVRDRSAIKQLIDSKLAPKKLKELFYTDSQWHQLREVGREARNSVRSIVRKIKKAKG